MNNNSLKKIERILFTVFFTLGIVVVVGIVLLIRFGNDNVHNEQNQSDEEHQEESNYDWEAGLSDNTLWLPDYCKIFSKVPEFHFTDEQGVSHSIREFEGKPLVVTFWASWCSDCQEQMPHAKEYIELAKKYSDISFIFINKLDREKETKDSAQLYFQKLGIDEPIYFDDGLSAYNRLGMHNIPTTLFLDSSGVITAWSPKQIATVSKFEALLNKALYGGSFATADFITSQLMDDDGGIHSTYGKNQDEIYSTDILSESEGIMLEYAVLSKDKELFDKILNYIKTHLWEDGLTAWEFKHKEASKVNALIDDLRIYDAIDEAKNLWGDYDEILENLQNRLLKYGMKNDKFVDFYNAKSKEYANRFTLCYGDLKTMQRLAEVNPAFELPYKTSKKLILNGKISKEFPLFYSYYNYKRKKYEKDDLNTAEAMVTLLHLSEMDLLPKDSLEWLKNKMEDSGVKARYSVKGDVVDGYNYDSTAVYALIAMIGVEEDDSTLINQAVKKMEKLRNDDVSLNYNGAYGLEDGSGISSFDQLMPLLAYMKIYGK